MARNLFGSELFLTSAGVVAQLYPNAPFTLWSERVGGVQYTDCVAPDGVTPLATNGANAFLADVGGQMPALRGPDGVVLMWVDSGSGVRYSILPPELVRDFLLAVGGLNLEQVQDAVAAMFGAQVTYDDAAGTVTLNITGGANQEQVEDWVAAMFGSQATYDDATGKLTLTVTGSSNTFRGNVASEAAQVALTASKLGDWCIRTDRGQRYDLTGSNPALISNWTAVPIGTTAVVPGTKQPREVWFEDGPNAWPASRPSTTDPIAYCGGSNTDDGPSYFTSLTTNTYRDRRRFVGAS